ncbi:hypothetical protein CK203_075447 [Vitis vinifera]|uniref:DUF6817 domain-containing protein n=1 Tax=Vitis vinifera TaxID=29760 RepID=A0A438EUB2_VITVI|nr:hypothetical protein CK203_075447 [Vitis vinifera]|eukprot:XP_010656033.1 PREDICTED: uncharacterized protein LOC100247588 [Vitis vinifera]
MPSSLSSSPSPDLHLQTLLASARPFLRGELEAVHPKLPSIISVLRSVGAGECWHKHGSFLEHLVDMYKILKLWKAQESVCLCGLFHSAYSNSYVNLAIFDPSTGRDTVRAHVGDAAEKLIHLFCVVPRQPLVHDDLIFRCSDDELVEHLKASEVSVRNAKEGGVVNGDEAWRKKVNSLVPPDGVTVKHIKTGRLEFSGNSYGALWPGDGKPGLWLNSISRMGAVYSLLVREEEIFIEERKRIGGDQVVEGRDEELELVIPPVLENCTRVLGAEEQIEATDLYWEAVCEGSKRGLDWAEELLGRCVEKNPFVGEPHVVLAQIYLTNGRFEEAEREAEKGLKLMLEWGSPWDKRMTWEGWIAWNRVLLMKAKERSWPNTSWGIINLGLVK